MTVKLFRLTKIRNLSALLMVTIVGMTGVYVWQNLQAASPFIGIESEAGTLKGQAMLIDDTTASSGKAIQFGSSTPTTVYYITPAGGGTKSGTNWQNAATLASIPSLLTNAPPGSEVWIHSDMGTYTQNQPIIIRTGGTTTRPIIIRGVTATGGNATRPVIVGNRTSPYSPTGNTGSEVFRLIEGASNLQFKNINFQNQGNGCFRIADDISNILNMDIK